MPLVTLPRNDYEVDFDLRYATANNFIGKPVYARADCYLHRDAAKNLRKAIDLAARLDMRLLLFDTGL